jgi:type II secretory pathway component PulF
MLRAIKIILEMLFWMVAAGAVIFAVAVVVGVVMTPELGYVAAVAVIGLLPLFVRTVRVIRRRRAAMAMSYLEQAVRLNLPLPRLLGAAQQSEHGKLALRLSHLRALLEEGHPVSAALEGGVPEVSPRDGALVEAAERIGHLPRALGRIVREHAGEFRRDAGFDAMFFRAYPIVMVVTIGLVVSMIGIFVLPKYEQIFKDFGSKLPPITINTIIVARNLAQPAVALIAAAVLLASGMALWQMVHPVRFHDSPLRRARDYTRWATPLRHGIDRDRGLADAMQLIADALGIGSPADTALLEASQLELNTVLRQRLRRWADAVSGGAALADSANAAGKPRVVWGMLSTVRGPEAPDVFRFLARYYRSRFSRTAALVQAAAVPALAMFFGLIVGCVAGALFIPMINLIDSISYQAMRL